MTSAGPAVFIKTSTSTEIMSTSGTEETIQARRQRLSALPRACDGCKVRKVKCDRKSPCSNCVAIGIACRGANTGSEPRSKIDKTQQLEKRIEALENRLRHVEDHNLTKNTRTEPSSAGQQRSIPARGTPSAFYEGQSSFSSQSVQAARITEAVCVTGVAESPVLDSRRTLLDSPCETADHHHVPLDYFSQTLSPHIPLPFDLVASILRRIKGRHCHLFD
jgi:hypothetical protein